MSGDTADEVGELLAAIALPARAVGGERRADALKAAVDVIVERGFERARFVDVATAINASVSALQYYFGSREAMLIEAFALAVSNDLQLLARAVDGAAGPWEQLTRLIDHGLAMDAGTERLMAVLGELSRMGSRNDHARRLVTLYDRSWHRPFEAAIHRGVTSGQFTPAASVAFVATRLVAVLYGTGIELGFVPEDERDCARQAHRDAIIADLRRWLNVP